ncbi:uncharacterized protein CDAR_273421 [Caerostris darwini]|uniref:Uncharacterized protein n=1 Tax=Caerostris darwini TaxID=1538125 RepID=A0AAV4W2S5_9ARAC|nr:uncharacterized protein CDAR_273421 [Caerostris darwini]
MASFVGFILFSLLFVGTRCHPTESKFEDNSTSVHPVTTEMVQNSTVNSTTIESTSVENGAIINLADNETSTTANASITTTFNVTDDYSYDEHVEVDADGCKQRLRNELEKECFDKFQDSVTDSIHLEDESQKEKDVCCAVEQYEKCCMNGFVRANCEKDKDAIKENLKAARIFLAALTSISCSSHRGKCSFSSAAQLPMSPILIAASSLCVAVLLRRPSI